MVILLNNNNLYYLFFNDAANWPREIWTKKSNLSLEQRKFWRRKNDVRERDGVLLAKEKVGGLRLGCLPDNLKCMFPINEYCVSQNFRRKNL